jgi:YbbR domain-containing protein
VRRLFGRIVHNWPLKLAAVGLATLMYGGLAVSQNTQAFTGVIPVRVENKPPDTVLLSRPEPVTQIRYYAPPDVPVATSTFRASVDLSDVPPTGDVTSVRIQVDSPDGRVRVLSFEPAFATIQLDKLVTKQVPVKVDHGAAPDGLELGPMTVTPTLVTASGAASVVAQVVLARADIQISDAIDIDTEEKLVPVDGTGNVVTPVDLDPSTVHVTMPVFSNKNQKSLPVNPIVTGAPAAGFEIAAVSVRPEVVTVQGDAADLSNLLLVDTLAVPVNGASNDVSQIVGLALPAGIIPIGVETVVVSVELRPVTSTRTFSVGVQLLNTRSDLTYDVSTKSVLLVVGGSKAFLDQMSGDTLVADLDVNGLPAGTWDVIVTADVPPGTKLVTASPPQVKVTITGPPATASPEPSGSGAPAASPSPSAAARR